VQRGITLMLFWITQYVSIILAIRFSKVYSYLLVLLMHVKSVIITTGAVDACQECHYYNWCCWCMSRVLLLQL